jgi:hypothetical protein
MFHLDSEGCLARLSLDLLSLDLLSLDPRMIVSPLFNLPLLWEAIIDWVLVSLLRLVIKYSVASMRVVPWKKVVV